MFVQPSAYKWRSYQNSGSTFNANSSQQFVWNKKLSNHVHHYEKQHQLPTIRAKNSPACRTVFIKPNGIRDNFCGAGDLKICISSRTPSLSTKRLQNSTAPRSGIAKRKLDLSSAKVYTPKKTFTTNFSVLNVNYSPKSIGKFAQKSRFKLVRKNDSKTKPIKHQSPFSNSSLLKSAKIIKKYSLRRVSINSYFSPYSKRRLYSDSSKHISPNFHRKNIINRYKFVRRSKSEKPKSKNALYKIDRRSERSPKISENVGSVGKRRSEISKRFSLIKNRNGKTNYCLFYIRYGRCARGAQCKFIHDPSKVAVCTRFLRGTCKIKDCPFSHVVSPDKMPVCQYFLRGVCVREHCPYLHVKHGKSAVVCPDFAKGFCAKGAKCDKKHTICKNVERTFTKKPVEKGGEKSLVDFKQHSLISKFCKKSIIPVVDRTSCEPLPEFIPLSKNV